MSVLNKCHFIAFICGLKIEQPKQYEVDDTGYKYALMWRYPSYTMRNFFDEDDMLEYLTCYSEEFSKRNQWFMDKKREMYEIEFSV